MPNIICKVGNYTNKDAIENLINYITGSFYFECWGSTGCYLVSVGDLATQIGFNFRAAQNIHNKTDGRLVQHLIIGFGDLAYTYEKDACTIGNAISFFYGCQGFQCFWGSHFGSDNNDSYRHIHIALNPVNVMTGERFCGGHESMWALKKFLEEHFPMLRWSYEIKGSYYKENDEF